MVIPAPPGTPVAAYATLTKMQTSPAPSSSEKQPTKKTHMLPTIEQQQLSLEMMRDEQRQQLQALQDQRAQAKALQEQPAIDPQLQALLLHNARQLQAMQLQNAQLLQSVQRAQAEQAAEAARTVGAAGAYPLSEDSGLLHVGAFDEPTIKLVSEIDDSLLGAL